MYSSVDWLTKSALQIQMLSYISWPKHMSAKNEVMGLLIILAIWILRVKLARDLS